MAEVKRRVSMKEYLQEQLVLRPIEEVMQDAQITKLGTAELNDELTKIDLGPKGEVVAVHKPVVTVSVPPLEIGEQQEKSTYDKAVERIETAGLLHKEGLRKEEIITEAAKPDEPIVRHRKADKKAGKKDSEYQDGEDAEDDL